MMEGLGIAGLVLMGLMMGVMMLGGHHLGRKGHPNDAAPKTATCPVSGNQLIISSGSVQATVGGKVYYFDNEDHQREYILEPQKFLRKREVKESD